MRGVKRIPAVPPTLKTSARQGAGMTMRAGMITKVGLMLVLSLLMGGQRAEAYELQTHSYLTKETVEFFNRHYPEWQIDEEGAAALSEGAVREDDFPRFLYHFYDPVYERGLTIGRQSWLSSKKWAQDEQAQLALRPNTLLAQLRPESYPTNFTWQKAMALYQAGNKGEALAVLGHILHLLQDIAVPDHTRNDQHLDGSPYEEYVGREERVINLDNRLPYELEGLDDYFKELATYSNNNFFSRDTLKSDTYNKPVKDGEIFNKDDGYFYEYKIDDLGNYYLSRKLLKSLLTRLDSSKTIVAPVVLSDYWNRLSVRAVQYGAGMLGLFFREVEKKSETRSGKSEAGSYEPKGVGEILRLRPAGSAQDDGDSGAELASRMTDGRGEIPRLSASGRIARDDWRMASAILGSRTSVGNDEGSGSQIESGMTNGVGGVREEDVELPFYLRFIKPELARGLGGVVMNGGVDSGAVFMVPKEVLRLRQLADQEINSGDDGGTAPKISGSRTSIGSPTSDGNASTGSVSSVEGGAIISEFLFDAEGSDEGKEFIKLTNRGSGETDLTDWSIQIKSSSGRLTKNNFEAGQKIAAGGYFWIWLGNGNAFLRQAQDKLISANNDLGMEWKSGSLTNAAGAIYLVKGTALLVSDSDPLITDRAVYEVAQFADFAPGDSLIRDGDVFRVKKKIQDDNYGNASTGSANNAEVHWNDGEWEASYDAATQEIVFQWAGDESVDLYDLGNGSTTLIYSGEGGLFRWPIKEVGRTYELGFINGNASTSHAYRPASPKLQRGEQAGSANNDDILLSRKSIIASSYLTKVDYYAGAAAGEHQLDLYFDKYPFVSGRQDAWKILIFFKNSEARDVGLLNTANRWQATDPSTIAAIWYNTAQSYRALYSLILPDIEQNSGIDGGVENRAFTFQRVGDNKLSVMTTERADYLTIAVYDFESSGGGSQNFALKALDRTKYFFRN